MSMLKLEIITPKKDILSTEAYMVIIPGTEGEFALLEGHMPLISNVDCGVIRVHDEDDMEISSVFVATATCSIVNDVCTILAEEAVLTSNINRIEVEKRLEHAQSILKEKKDDLSDHDLLHYERDLEIAMKMLEVLINEKKGNQ